MKWYSTSGRQIRDHSYLGQYLNLDFLSEKAKSDQHCRVPTGTKNRELPPLLLLPHQDSVGLTTKPP